jgi:hypothetical protein
MRCIAKSIAALALLVNTCQPAQASDPIGQALVEYNNGRIVSAQLTGPLKWIKGTVNVYHNPKGSPLPDYTAQAIIEYAAWSWQQRTGLDINYQGLTNETQIVGAIVVQWATQQQLMSQSGGILALGLTSYRYHSLSGSMVSARLMLLDTDWQQDWQKAIPTLMHEMGHSIGINGHSDNSAAIMYPYRQTDDRYALTAADVMLTGYQHNICHAELTPHGDVYIPNIAGHGVTLRSNGEMYRVVHDHITGVECSGSYDGSHAIIFDVRGFDTSYKNVVLKQQDNAFKVVEFMINQ